jgi:ribosomal protein S18 acetylase RimI-like enzyme
MKSDIFIYDPDRYSVLYLRLNTYSHIFKMHNTTGRRYVGPRTYVSGSTEEETGVIEPITNKNYKDVLNIKIDVSNKDFVSNMIDSLLQASYTPGWEGYAYRVGDRIIGFCSIAPFSFKALSGWKICKLVIDKNYYRQGHGRKLLSAILDKIDERATTVTLSVNTKNIAAIKLYESLGFVQEQESKTPKLVFMTRTHPQ